VSLAVVLTAGALTGIGKLVVYGDPAEALRAFRAPTGEAPRTLATPEPVASAEPLATAVVYSRETEVSTPVPAASPSSAPPPPRLWLSPYRLSGRSYVGVVGQQGILVLAPFAGIVEVRTYQFIDREIRVGSNLSSLPFFPYVTVSSADRRMIYRPGALGIDVELTAATGARIAAGEPLFRVTGTGLSSWATFYDSSVPFQIVVSLQSLPSGRDLDPTDLIKVD
jgi:hypothetical protein